VATDPAPPVALPGLGLWEEPTVVLERLDELSHECETRLWAVGVQSLLGKLGAAVREGSPQALAILADLAAATQQAEGLADAMEDEPDLRVLAGMLRRAGHTLARRLGVWEQAIVSDGQGAGLAEPVAPDPRRLAVCLAAVRRHTAGSPQGLAWSHYLALDALSRLADEGDPGHAEGRQVARLVMRRMSTAPLTRGQREFLAREPIASLKAELRRWAVEPVELSEVARHIERYERSGLSADARRLAEDCQGLALSPVPARQALGRQLEACYRNANVRLAVSRELLNRLIPERPPEYGCVDDVVLGSPVHGQSLTSTKVLVRLIPDPRRARLALEIRGLVSSLTQSTSGPATFYNDSQSVYRAWKEIEVGPEGLLLKPAEVAVSSDLRLHALETDFDEIPLLGAIAQEVARSKHQEQHDQMTSEVEEKVYVRAKRQVDAEADARLSDLANRLQDRLVEPIAELSVGPEVVGAETTDQRVSMRLRVGSDDQLGGHTPRPRAPSDSLASFQIHESAFGNLVEQLRLDGQTFTVPQLRQRLAARLHRPEMLLVKTDEDDISITFAPIDAARVRCDQGQVVVSLSIARLSRQGQTWEDFQVRAFYRPVVRGRTASLVREDAIHLIGDRVQGRAQFALRGIFGRVFSKDQPIPLIPARVATDPRVAGLAVTQLVIEDGWIGLALGQDRPERPPAVARRPGQTD
jgi:hypothetical protein